MIKCLSFSVETFYAVVFTRKVTLFIADEAYFCEN
jgi:hypothetical protein